MAAPRRPSAPHYRFDDVVVDRRNFSVIKGLQEKGLTPRAFDVLHYLIEHSDRVVEKQELFEQVWGEKCVTDNALTRTIKEIRHVIGDSADSPRYIETVPKRGYRFIAEAHGLAGREVVYTEEVEGVRLTIEEEGLEGEKTRRVKSPAASLPWSRPRGSSWAVTLALARAVVALAAVTLILSRHPDPGESRPTPIRSIAVLPLKNLTDDPAQEYFSDGMTESLITALSKTEGLKVISRGSVFGFKGKEADPREVGKQLGVASVLEGSVRKSTDSVRVTVRLVSAEDGRVLWASDTNDHALGDIFALQDDVARRVVDGLRLELGPEGERRLAKRYTDNVEAYEAYLKGRYFWNKRTEEGLKKGIGHFQQAIRIDPDYALAYAGLSDSYGSMGSLGLLPSEDARTKAKAAAEKALEIDEALAEAHVSLAWLDWWDWSAAEKDFKRALELNPNNASAHQWYAGYLTAVGRFDEAIAEIRRAQQLDPFSLTVNAIAGQTYFLARRYDEAIEECRKILEMDPHFFLGHHFLAAAYAGKGMYEEAIAEAKRAKELEDNPITLCLLAHIYAASGSRAEAEKVLHEILKRKSVPPYSVAVIYAALGEREVAFKWLEKAVNERNEHLIWLKVDPFADPLRSDPRFQDLVRRVGLVP